MTDRDEFALMAAEVFLERYPLEKIVLSDRQEWIAKAAYQFADYMLQARDAVEDSE